MPKRRLPDSGITRLKALQTGKERKDAIPAPLVIPYTTATITWLDTFYPAFKLKVEAVEAALVSQTSVSNQVRITRHLAELFISHFYQAMQNAVLRETYEPSVRGFYGLDVNNGAVPVLNSEEDITFWGDKAAVGEAARIAAGGTAIPFPTIAQVNTAVNAFKAANQLQGNAKEIYDNKQEIVEADNPEADRLILKMWNETETAFDTGNKPSMRRKAREWGVYYAISTGETLSPDEFSITGKITDAATGNPVADVEFTIIENSVSVISESDGDYFVGVQPPATYSVHVQKPGFQSQLINSVVVAAGVITTLNISLVAGADIVTVVREGDLNMGVITRINTDDIHDTVTTTIAFETTVNTFRVYAAVNVTDFPGAVFIDITPGMLVTHTPAELITLLGLGPAKPNLMIQNIGAGIGHWKATFNNVTEG